MNATRQRNRKTGKAPSKRIADVGHTAARKSAKRTGGQSYKLAGEASPQSFKLELHLSRMLYFFHHYLSCIYSIYNVIC